MSRLNMHFIITLVLHKVLNNVKRTQPTSLNKGYLDRFQTPQKQEPESRLLEYFEHLFVWHNAILI